MILPGTDSRTLWRHINKLANTANAQIGAASLLAANAARSRQRTPDVAPVFHPFKIYTLPSFLRASPNLDNDWHQFRVRSGVIIVDSSDGTAADGTDGADNPDGTDYPDVADISVPPGTDQYWFWLEISGATTLAAAVKSGADPTMNGWDDFPTFDGKHFPIGWVDTLKNQADRSAVIRQYLRSDLYLPGVAVQYCEQGVNTTGFSPTVLTS